VDDISRLRDVDNTKEDNKRINLFLC